MEEFNYLASPSVYSKLLKFMVISWFVKGKTMVIVVCLLQIDDVYESGCDIVTNNDNEEIIFIDFPLKLMNHDISNVG